MMIVGIDRIEEKIAVCETGDGKSLHVSVSLFFPEAKEGAWYQKHGEQFIYDEEMTAQKRSANAALLQSLLSKRE